MSLEFLNGHFDEVSYLQNLLIARATGKPSDPIEYQQLRNKLLGDGKVSAMLPSWLRLHRDLDSFWDFIQPKFASYAERRTYLSQQFSPLLDALEQSQVGTGIEMPMLAPTPPTVAGSLWPIQRPLEQNIERNKRNVFIVHGRDNEVKQEVSRFVEGLQLKAIVLHEQASSGMTIIEKIERYSGDADFALVLYTPCDLGRGVHESKIPAKNRARQNVVFEHGYLMAKLGRQNVCALVKGVIETPNDISGVVYVPLDQAGGWKAEVIKELRACGYSVPSW